MSAARLLAVSDNGASSLAGPAALLIVLLLFVATVFLIRNMDKRLRRLPREFPQRGDGKGGTTQVEGPVEPPAG